MKAAYRTRYGQPDVLQVKEIDPPVPKEHELLIRVYAASVNRSSYHVLTGKPYFMRLFTGLFKPKLSTTGCDYAGRIEKVGSQVKLFKPGDEVMGFGGGLDCGSHAEYLVIDEKKGTVIKPASLSFEQAAACVEGTFYAAALINEIRPDPGKTAIVYGATGAIGSATLQFLKYFGCYVTAVCEKEQVNLVRSLGADEVLDYRTDEFRKHPIQYDFFFDSVGKFPFHKAKRFVKKYGTYSSSGGAINLFWVFVTKFRRGKKVVFAWPKDIPAELNFIKRVVEEGKFQPVIDRVYPLEKIAEAFTYVGSGKKIGNVIVTM